MSENTVATQSKGEIVQVIGAIVDIEFSEQELPSIMNAIRIVNPDIPEEEQLIVEVPQKL